MIDAKLIQKYQKYTVSKLIQKCQTVFNKFIRLRDKDEICISCKNPKATSLQAGHFYSAGQYPSLRFEENNVNRQCVRCNMHLHGNLNYYRINLEKKIGKQALQELDDKAAYYKRNVFKWDRISLISKIIEYKQKVKDYA